MRFRVGHAPLPPHKTHPPRVSLVMGLQNAGCPLLLGALAPNQVSTTTDSATCAAHLSTSQWLTSPENCNYPPIPIYIYVGSQQICPFFFSFLSPSPFDFHFLTHFLILGFAPIIDLSWISNHSLLDSPYSALICLLAKHPFILVSI